MIHHYPFLSHFNTEDESCSLLICQLMVNGLMRFQIKKEFSDAGHLRYSKISTRKLFSLDYYDRMCLIIVIEWNYYYMIITRLLFDYHTIII